MDDVEWRLAEAENALESIRAPGTLSAYWKNRALYAEDALKRTADKLAELEGRLMLSKVIDSYDE
jgi:hypothetical protein